MSCKKKFEIIKIAQENQHLHKRITERRSFYNAEQWERDYYKNQYYKRNHCVFPVIDFCHTDSDYPKYKSNTSRFTKFNSTTSQFQNQFRTSQEGTNTQDEDMSKILYKKTDYILHLELCYIEFSVHTHRYLLFCFILLSL